MENTEFKTAEHRAIEKAVENARDVAEYLAGDANEKMADWLENKGGVSDSQIERARGRFELSQSRAKKAINLYRFLTRAVYS
jgi:DNA-binding transcriptional regulator YiaG